YLIGVAFFFFVFKFVPSTRVDWHFALVSAIVTSLLWNLARQAYAIYTSRVLTYSKIYGSLGAIPIFLLWIYILWVITLSGVALSAALQRRLLANESRPRT